MKIESAHARHDAPIGEGEIEIAPATLAQAPVRIAKDIAVPALVAATAAETEFERTVAEARAEMAAKRAAALALQAEFDRFVSERDGLAALLVRADQELATCLARMQELCVYAESHWSDGTMLQDVIEEHDRQKFLADRLPDWIEKMRRRHAELAGKIASFREKHGMV